MSNSVNNLTNCFFYLFVLCFFSSCVVEERYEVNEETGLEWTFKKYRNGDESITLSNVTIKGQHVTYFAASENLFTVYSDSIDIYKGTEISLNHVVSLPYKGYYDGGAYIRPVGVSTARKYGKVFRGYYCSEEGDFWIIHPCLKNGKLADEIYTSDGKYITTITPGEEFCIGFAIDNELVSDDIADYYMISKRKAGEVIRGIFDVQGRELIPICYKDISYPIFWDYLGEVSNTYYFEAEKGSFKYENNIKSTPQYCDIYSQTGELLLSIDNQNNLYVANGKQYSFSNSKIEYKSSSFDPGELWVEIKANDTFKGRVLRKLKVYETSYPGDEYWRAVEHGYYYTMIEDKFYIIHTEHSFSNDFSYIIESIRIPIEATTGKNNISKSSASSKSALDMVRDVLMTDITDSFFENPKSYFIQKATIGKRTDTYEKGESFLIIGDNRMTTQWADGSGRTNKMAPKNITIYDLDGEEKTALAYALDDGLAVRAMNSGGTKYILLYTYNKSMKSYVQMGSYSLYN